MRTSDDRPMSAPSADADYMHNGLRSGLEAPQHLRVEGFPAGNVSDLRTGRPRLSFELPGTPPGWRQASYEVEIVRERGGQQSYKVRIRVESAATDHLRWPDEALRAGEQAVIRIRVHGTGIPRAQPLISSWSDPITLITSLDLSHIDM